MLQAEDEKKRAEAAKQAAGPKIGETFRDCPECPEMVVVPAGEFTMGSPESEESRGNDEGATRTVKIAKPIAVGKFEVTFAEWDACVAAGGCKQKPEADWGRGRQPVMRVSWDDTKEFTAWLSKKTGKPYRLLTEAEWEYAARAGTTTPFSFGKTITPDQANFNGNYTYGGSSKGQYREKTIDVGSFKPNAFGLHDMHGNVWEWVEDCYQGSYKGAPKDGAAASATSGCSRVVRGGSWNNYPWILRAAFRGRGGPVNRDSFLGFRVGRLVVLPRTL
jgi:formylglycine-generating enzyme required for sulfatase activity